MLGAYMTKAGWRWHVEMFSRSSRYWSVKQEVETFGDCEFCYFELRVEVG